MSEPRQPIGQPIVYPGLSSWKSQIIGYEGFLFQKKNPKNISKPWTKKIYIFFASFSPYCLSGTKGTSYKIHTLITSFSLFVRVKRTS
jgi:hypothetical protein